MKKKCRNIIDMAHDEYMNNDYVILKRVKGVRKSIPQPKENTNKDARDEKQKFLDKLTEFMNMYYISKKYIDYLSEVHEELDYLYRMTRVNKIYSDEDEKDDSTKKLDEYIKRKLNPKDIEEFCNIQHYEL